MMELFFLNLNQTCLHVHVGLNVYKIYPVQLYYNHLNHRPSVLQE